LCKTRILLLALSWYIQTHWFFHLILLRRHHKMVPKSFSYPVRWFLHARDRRHLLSLPPDAVPVPSTGTGQEVGPLTSSPSSRGQSSGGALWRAGYTPGDRLTSWVYSTTFVQCLYISCYLSENKPVLSYLLLRLLPQDENFNFVNY
jgi:hypothetical protein